MSGLVFCSPHYAELGDDNESRCCNFKTKRQKDAERQMDRADVMHFTALRLPSKVQFLQGIVMLVFGLLLVFSAEFMAYSLFMGEEYMQEQGMIITHDQALEEIQARDTLEQLQLQETMAEEEARASDTIVMNILTAILGPDVNPTTRQKQIAQQAAHEAQLRLQHIESVHEEVVNEQRAKATASIPFQQFSRLYGAVVIAVAVHALCTCTIDYSVNCTHALLYIGFFMAQAVALLMAVMPVVKVDDNITTIISSNWLLKVVLLATAVMCGVWVWLYQRLRIAKPYISAIMDAFQEDEP